MQFAAVSDTGRVRDNNEDSYCLGELEGPDWSGLVLLAVADGVGGCRAGEVASSLAIRALRQYLAQGARGCAAARAVGQQEPMLAPGAEGWEHCLRVGIGVAHQAVVRQARAVSSLRGMGTTLTAAVLHGSAMYWGHVGDSRAYLVRRGRLSLLTHDHSVAGQLLAAGRIGAEAARRHPRRHELTQALGLGEHVQVETGWTTLQAGDWLLLATDGLTAVVGDEEIAAVVRASTSASGLCRTLVALANARGGPDNITVVAAQA